LLFSLLFEFLAKVICYHWSVPAASNRRFSVIASQRVGAMRRPMTGYAKQSSDSEASWIASSLRSSQ
jgi:hypothetical protein